MTNDDRTKIAHALELFAGIDEGENTDYDELLRLASVVRDAAWYRPSIGTELIAARAAIKEAAQVIERDGRRKEGRARAVRMMNGGLVNIRNAEIKLGAEATV